MTQYDDLFNGEKIDVDIDYQNNESFDKEKWAEEKKALRESLYDLSDKTAEKLSSDPNLFKTYLDVQSRFMSYSANNALLIAAQKPDATVFRGFKEWKEDNIFANKGEKGFYIFEQGDQYVRDDGSIGTNYNPKKVLDITQTRAKPIKPPKLPDERTSIRALMNKCPAVIEGVDDIGNDNIAYFDQEKNTIYIQKGLPADDLFRGLSKEIYHAHKANGNPEYDRNDNELNAYCASYMLSKRYGFSTKGYDLDRTEGSFDLLAPQEIKEQLNEMKKGAYDISGNMYKFFENEKKAKEQSGQER